jgi:hypothetical protein
MRSLRGSARPDVERASERRQATGGERGSKEGKEGADIGA